MDKLSVIGKIGTILSDLKEQQEYFAKNLQSLNEVEVELFAASANYLAEYAKVLKKFPVSRAATPLVPPRAAAQAVHQYDDDDIGFRLSFEEDEKFDEDNKKIHQPGTSEKQKPQVKEEPLAQHLREAAETGEDAAAREGRDPEAPDPKIPGPQAEQSLREKAGSSREGIAQAFLDPEPAARKSDALAQEQPAARKSDMPAPEKPASSDAPAASEAPAASVAPSTPLSGVPASEKPSAPTTNAPTASDPPAPEKSAPPRTNTPASEQPGAGKSDPPSPEQPASAAETPATAPPTNAPRPEPRTSEGEQSRKLSLNERFGEKRPTLYERITSQKAKQSGQSPPSHTPQSPPSDQMQQSIQTPEPQQSQPPKGPAGTPIANLGRSIGINERYYFIKTLFHDDKVAFDQAITRIDMCHSLGEALEYTNRSLSGKYNWSRKEEDARKFYDLLKRRFV